MSVRRVVMLVVAGLCCVNSCRSSRRGAGWQLSLQLEAANGAVAIKRASD